MTRDVVPPAPTIGPKPPGAELEDCTRPDLERRLRQQAAELEAVNRELDALTYAVSHDLRAPLRSIDGFGQALLEDCRDKLEDDGKRYLRHVREAAQEMATMIDDLLKLSRVTRSELRRQSVNLSEVARSIVARLERTQPGRTVEVRIQDGLVAIGDARLLGILLENLIDNAWKFTAKQPRARIEVGGQMMDRSLVYFVRDNGAGFDMAHAQKLFGAFQRLHSAHEFKGKGIGLATVQRIVRRHGGRVWAEGTVNRGATFYFTLESEGQA